MAIADDIVLSMVEGEVLTQRVVEGLLRVVDTSPDPTPGLTARQEQLHEEVNRLVKLVAGGLAVDAVAAEIKKRELEIARIEQELRAAQAPPPALEKLRDALLQRSSEWKANLRGEIPLARLVLQRLVEPLVLAPAPAPSKARPSFVERPTWAEVEAQINAEALLDGLAKNCTGLLASPTGTAKGCTCGFSGIAA